MVDYFWADLEEVRVSRGFMEVGKEEEFTPKVKLDEII